MIHGGIRYLENGEFRLVQESVVERNRLLKIAPHYVKPLQTTIPVFSTFSGILSAPLRFLTHKQGKPTERGAVLIKLGLSIYDFFSRDGGSVPRHRFVPSAQQEERDRPIGLQEIEPEAVPGLARKGQPSFVQVERLLISIHAVGGLGEVVVGAKGGGRPVVLEGELQRVGRQRVRLLGARPTLREDAFRVERL